MPASSEVTPSLKMISTSVAIKKINEQIHSNKPFILGLHVADLNELWEKLENHPSRRAFRCTYNDEHNFVVRSVPSGAHEAMVRGMYNAIMNHLSIIGRELPVGLKSTGCATYRLSADNEPVRRKQADDSIAELTPHSLSPVIVFESGVSESLTQLQVDAKSWLESKNLNVQLVIVMSLGTPIVNNTPTFTVEQWIVDPNPPIRTLRSNLKKAICYHTSDWTHAVPQPYSIDITRFYVLNAIPAPLTNVTNMVLDANVLADLREWVINAWRVEQV